MFQLDLTSRKSIYTQIVDNIKELIVTRVLKANERLPSVRELSKTLTVNPNTIQKAYHELEEQGFIYTISGSGCFVAPSKNESINKEKQGKIKEQLTSYLNELQFLGMTTEEIRELMEEIMSKRGDIL